MNNRNAQLIGQHLAAEDPDDHVRRMREARRLAIDADTRRTKAIIWGVLAIPFVLFALVAVAWVASHVFLAALHALGITFAILYVVATVAMQFWSGGFFSAARTIKHWILKALGRHKPSLVPLSSAKGVGAVVSSAMWWFGFSIASHLSHGPAAMVMTFGSFISATPLLIGSVYAFTKHRTELRLAGAGHASEVEAIYAEMKRDEEAEFADDVNAHLANMGAPAPEPVAAVEESATLPHVNWDQRFPNDDDPLRPM